ncbi:MAG: CPBP family intramembrane metalloprotease [Bacteroidales bacterium]|nr:CPBP family intramembrane metalloprotease [Bacteroidales bacterium]
MRSDSVCGRMPLWKWIVLFVCGLLLFFFIYGLSQGFGMMPENRWVKFAVQMALGVVILLLYGGYIRFFERRRVYELDFRHFAFGFGNGLAIGLIYFCLVTVFLALCGCYRINGVCFRFDHLLSAFGSMFLVAVGEEVVFRGIMFRMIDERWNMWVALAVSGLLFGFLHIFNPGAGVFSSVCIAIEAGLLLGMAYKYTESLWLPIGIHLSWNFTQGAVFGFAVSGGDIGYALFQPSIEGHRLLTGAAFGPEASLPGAVLGLALSVLLYLLFRKKSKA